MKHQDTLHLVTSRIRDLGAWLEDAAPYVQQDQRHLDGGTPEQAYWHLGYRSGLLDLLAVIRSLDASRPDSAIHSPEADPDV